MNVCLRIVLSVVSVVIFLCKGREIVVVLARSEAPEFTPASPIDIPTLWMWTIEAELQFGRDVPVEEGMSERYIQWQGSTRMKRMKGVNTLSEVGDTANRQTLWLMV